MKHDDIPELPQRGRPAHGVRFCLGLPTIVFVTVCTGERRRWLANEPAHDWLLRIWARSTAWHVGRYILMPDHVHFFCAPSDADVTLDNWMKFWKRLWTREIGRPERRWQSGYWDTRLRGGESYHVKWEYVRQNPARAGLIKDADQWSYQGCMHELRW